jgi:hypothetical protein
VKEIAKTATKSVENIVKPEKIAVVDLKKEKPILNQI